MTVKHLRILIAVHLYLLGLIYLADGAILHNPAYMRQGALMPLIGYGIALIIVGTILYLKRSIYSYDLAFTAYVALAVSFWGTWTAVVTYLWMATLVFVVAWIDYGS